MFLACSYCALKRIGKPKPGETVFVTGAAGVPQKRHATKAQHTALQLAFVDHLVANPLMQVLWA